MGCLDKIKSGVMRVEHLNNLSDASGHLPGFSGCCRGVPVSVLGKGLMCEKC